jgi:hypothetical protein
VIRHDDDAGREPSVAQTVYDEARRTAIDAAEQRVVRASEELHDAIIALRAERARWQR